MPISSSAITSTSKIWRGDDDDDDDVIVLQAAVMALAPATMVSRRCTKKARGIFLREINEGGLILLNEVNMQIVYVLFLLGNACGQP